MKILYDKKILKLIKILATVAVALVLLGVACMLFEIRGTAVLMLICLTLGGTTLLVCAEGYLSVLCYFRRLKRYGYEIPDNKNDYGKSLENLPKNKTAVNYEEKHKESLFSLVMALLSYLGCLTWTITCIIKWRFMFENAAFVCIGMGILDLIWVILSIVFALQMNQQKYRDDVDLSSNKRSRIQLEFAIGLIILLLGMTVFIKATGYNILEYSFKSLEMNDIDKAEQIKCSVDAVYNEYKDSEQITEIDTMLKTGLIISEYGIPTDNYMFDVATDLGVSDLCELQNQFHLADGAAVVHVQLVGGKVIVKLMNPMKQVDKEIIAK